MRTKEERLAWSETVRKDFYTKQGCPQELIETLVRCKNKKTRHRIFLLWRDKSCQKCGSVDNLTVDHIVPVSITRQRRRANIANKRILCKRCNNEKGNSLSYGMKMLYEKNRQKML